MTNFEQQVNLFHGIFVYCGIAALLMLAVAVALFFVLKIPQVFSEITGRGARKAIEEMEGAGAVSMRIGEDGRKKRKGFTGAETEAVGQNIAQEVTESMETGKMPQMMVSWEEKNVENTSDLSETFDLGETFTDVLNHKSDDAEGSSSTTVLSHEGISAAYQPPQPDTTVLNAGMRIPAPEFRVLRTILEVHTDEVIE